MRAPATSQYLGKAMLDSYPISCQKEKENTKKEESIDLLCPLKSTLVNTEVINLRSYVLSMKCVTGESSNALFILSHGQIGSTESVSFFKNVSEKSLIGPIVEKERFCGIRLKIVEEYFQLLECGDDTNVKSQESKQMPSDYLSEDNAYLHSVEIETSHEEPNHHFETRPDIEQDIETTLDSDTTQDTETRINNETNLYTDTTQGIETTLDIGTTQDTKTTQDVKTTEDSETMQEIETTQHYETTQQYETTQVLETTSNILTKKTTGPPFNNETSTKTDLDVLPPTKRTFQQGNRNLYFFIVIGVCSSAFLAWIVFATIFLLKLKRSHQRSLAHSMTTLRAQEGFKYQICSSKITAI